MNRFLPPCRMVGVNQRSQWLPQVQQHALDIYLHFEFCVTIRLANRLSHSSEQLDETNAFQQVSSVHFLNVKAETLVYLSRVPQAKLKLYYLNPYILRYWYCFVFYDAPNSWGLFNKHSLSEIRNAWLHPIVEYNETHVRGFFDTDLHEVSWHFATHSA